MRIIIIALTFITILSCKDENEFVFTGKVDEIKNGEYLILHDLFENETITTSIVKNNDFFFKTKLKNLPLFAMLHNEDRSISKHIWIESNEMTFNSIGVDFKKAKITGSKSHKLEEDFYKDYDHTKNREMKIKTKSFISKNSNSLFSIYLLSNNVNTWGVDSTKILYSKFPIKLKKSAPGKRVSDFLKTAKLPKVGEKVIDFEMTDINGNKVKLSDFKGKVILLEFWASWCKPCRYENPKLLKTYKKFHENGFEILAISLDTDKKSWIKAIKKDNLEWKHVSDLKKGSLAEKLYGVTSIPDNFLIDRNMKLIGNNIKGKELRDKLSEIMPTTNKELS